MGLSPAALLKGIVSRILPPPTKDSGAENEAYARFGRYREQAVASAWPTDHLQADEGSLFVASTSPAATALQLGILAAFDATKAAIVVYNGAPPDSGLRTYLKKLKLAQSAAPTSGVDLRYAIVLDSISRIPTTLSSAAGALQGPGTPATATAYRAPLVSANMDIAPAAYTQVYFPLSTAAGLPPAIPAASPNARVIVGNGFIKNSIPVVKDQYVVQFGGVDAGGTFQAAAALAKIVEHAPAVVIGPGQSAVIHIWSASNITAGNAWDDVLLELIEK